MALKATETNPSCCCTPAYILDRPFTGGTSSRELSQTVQMEPTAPVLVLSEWQLWAASLSDDQIIMSHFQYDPHFNAANSSTLDDRRREIRFNDGERAVIVWSHNAEARGPLELINRSEQGLCVRSEDAVPPGALGTILRILPWSEAENRRAVVTWCHADEHSGWQLGLRFVDSRPHAA